MEENLREEATGAKAGARADARSSIAGRAMRFIFVKLYGEGGWMESGATRNRNLGPNPPHAHKTKQCEKIISVDLSTAK
jgi:hypothetical protein